MRRSVIGLLGMVGLLISAAISGSSVALAIGNFVSVQDTHISAQNHLLQAYTKKPKPKKKVWKASVRTHPSTRSSFGR